MTVQPAISPLRVSHRRARSLDFAEQLKECVDQLQHPELIAEELRLAHEAGADRVADLLAADSLARTTAQSGPAASPYFYPTRDIFVVRDSSSFTCLANGIHAGVGDEAGSNPMDDALAARPYDGLDYAAITCTAKPRPILAVVQNDHERSAYPLLLRLLAGICELGHLDVLDRLGRDAFRGMLGGVPSFELHLVLHDDWEGEEVAPELGPLSELSRDLAEVVKSSLSATAGFPPILDSIVCLHMNPNRFDGRVRFSWRV